MLECTVLPNTGQSQKWKVAKWMAIVYCFGWKPSVYWITLNGSWMIHQCFHLLFGRIWEKERVCFASVCFVGWIWLKMRWYEERICFHCRYGLLSWKLAIICMKPKHSALTISWWLKQLFLQTKEQQIPPQIPWSWKHYLSFKQEYAALKCTPNEQNKLTNKQKTKQKPFISVKNSMWAIAINLATFHFWLWPVFGSTVHSSIT